MAHSSHAQEHYKGMERKPKEINLNISVKLFPLCGGGGDGLLSPLVDLSPEFIVSNCEGIKHTNIVSSYVYTFSVLPSSMSYRQSTAWAPSGLLTLCLQKALFLLREKGANRLKMWGSIWKNL